MKRLNSALFSLLFLPGFAVAQRHYHPTSLPSKTTQVTNLNQKERERIEQCVAPNQPRPETPIKMAVLRAKAISLPKPAYPEEAKVAKASGTVKVDVVISEEGKVIWAKTTSGHPMLLESSVRAACQARYTPTRVAGKFVKVNGVVTYNFVRP